jgi:hypothetical protein
LAQIHELRGCDLYYWCAPEPRHGDMVLRLANAEDAEFRRQVARDIAVVAKLHPDDLAGGSR